MTGQQHKVKIDGKENTLTLIQSHGANSDGHQYNTAGNESGHRFRRLLKKGDKFKTNGCNYEILD